MSDLVLVDRGPVAVVTLNRPERRNALNAAMLQAIFEALDSLSVDGEARCVLLRGEGKHFCAGADFSDVAEGAATGARYGAGFEQMLRAIEDHPLPVVAAVQGAALGAGCQLLAATDLSIAADDARIGIPSARLGILLDLEKVQRMVQVVGPAHTRELLLSGRELDGKEAASWGLVTRTVPSKSVDQAARALAEEVAANAPLSVRGSKAAIRAVMRHAALDRDAHAGAFGPHDEAALRALTSSDVAEGLKAMNERRPPEFKGE
ncbi:MAG TPA: enoyl-CoA hydratase/isomerase family protein [Actinomycetota bacterium]|nr:enoyl-CoA hydratase/isomerase family protein [Actinomycetota bacterium]